MKANKIKILITSLVILFLVILTVSYLFYHILFKKPLMTSLIPDSTLVYVNMLNMNETISAIEKSEFIKRFTRSKLWNNIQSSGLWQIISQHKSNLEEKLGLDRNMLMKLIGKNAIFAVNSKNHITSFVLISELDVVTRLVLTSGKIEKNIADEYEFAKEEYKGIKLMTISLPGQIICYSFIGRIGILSNSSTTIKDIIDKYKEKSADKFSKMFADILPSNIYIYLNTQRAKEIENILRAYNINVNFSDINIIKSSNTWIATANSQDGNLRIDSLIFYKNGYNQMSNSEDIQENYTLPIPGKSLILLVHKKQDTNLIFDLLSKYLAPQINLIRNELETLFSSSLAEAVIKPDIREFRMVPPVLIFLQVRNRVIAETMLNNFRIFMKKLYPNLSLDEIDYENNKIIYIRSFPGFLLPIGVGYSLLEDNLFVISTELYALKDVIDTYTGKKRSFIDDKEYQNIMKFFTEKADTQAFINLRTVVPIVDQIAKLYIWQGRLLGKRNYERSASAINENIPILQNWNYLGLSFKKYDNRAKLSLVLKK